MLTRTVLTLCVALAFFAGLASAQLAGNEKSARIMRLDKFVVPDFPEFLRRTGVREGTVVVAISHEALGKPDDILVLESTDSRFTEAALEAIKLWRFESPPAPSAPTEALVPVVRFLFASSGVSVVSLMVGDPAQPRFRVRGDTPVELPNFSHLDAEPKPLHQPMPRLPDAQPPSATSRNGTALVKFFVDTDGRARVPVAITATTPQLGDAAVAAVRQWRFEPPRLNGKPVIALETRVFRFGSPTAP